MGSVRLVLLVGLRLHFNVLVIVARGSCHGLLPNVVQQSKVGKEEAGRHGDLEHQQASLIANALGCIDCLWLPLLVLGGNCVD